ncbi:MAG: tripartite tricarboxylate transporter substrate binding protein [Betaproteobacteria bacterium]|nr:MAG: tripartite tricarboxylate transporter substrate binding protein [Betaproteobacteria bacterium]
MRNLLLWLGLFTACAASAEYPEKPVHIVVPYVAGAMGDVVSRLLAEELRPKLGQPVIVDNRPGAGGNIGTGAVAAAEPDGYTVVVGATNNFVINQFLYKGMGFDPLAKLSPVTILVDVPSVIFINAQVPGRTFADFVRYAKANKGKVNYGSPGAGTTPHLSAALINQTRDLGMTHIPYKGAAQVVSALLANEVQFYMGGAGLGAQHVKAGKLYAVAVSNDKRLPALPDTPTFNEVGLGDINASNYWAVAVPKGTSAEIIDKLYQAFRASLAAPASAERFARLGIVAVGTTPEETAKRWREEAAFWAKAVKEMQVRVD